MSRKTWPRLSGGIRLRGRHFTATEVAAIREIIRRHPTWGRTRISQRVCERLEWYQAHGRLKERACRVALVRLEKAKLLKLPRPLICNGGKRPSTVPLRELLPDPVPLTSMPEAVEPRLVETEADGRLWNSAVQEHHYLGLATPVGRLVRHLIYADGQLVGASSFSECVWSLSARARAMKAIGLDPARASEYVVNNNRFLILPHAHVPNLASRALSSSLRRLSADWATRYGASPLLAETFVDPGRFFGTCYRAANWLVVGESKGFAKSGSRHVKHRAAKLYLLRGIDSAVHRRLECALRKGNAWEREDRLSNTSKVISSKIAA